MKRKEPEHYSGICCAGDRPQYSCLRIPVHNPLHHFPGYCANTFSAVLMDFLTEKLRVEWKLFPET